ncbi:MAG: hypothetical protein M0T77_09005 [Actinomycetota bacterium]|nr:hypothetical protein [Actinomycetota bacterium]
MFNFLRTPQEIDTSLFDPDEDMDLVLLINTARTEQEIQRVARMSRARMRARRRQREDARHPNHPESLRARGLSAPSTLSRGI